MPTKLPLDNPTAKYKRDQLFPEIAGSGWHLPFNLAASTIYVRGQAVAEIVASPGTAGPYNSAGTDGTQNPTMLVPYDCVTDANGNITPGAASDPAGYTLPAIDLWVGGIFLAVDIKKASGVAMDSTLAGKLGKSLTSTYFKLN